MTCDTFYQVTWCKIAWDAEGLCPLWITFLESFSVGWWKSLQDTSPTRPSDWPCGTGDAYLSIAHCPVSKIAVLKVWNAFASAWSDKHKRKSDFLQNPKQLNAIVEVCHDRGDAKEALYTFKPTKSPKSSLINLVCWLAVVIYCLNSNRVPAPVRCCSS